MEAERNFINPDLKIQHSTSNIKITNNRQRLRKELTVKPRLAWIMYLDLYMKDFPGS